MAAAAYLRDGRAPVPASEVISRVMSANRGRDTKPEIRLRKALWAAGAKGYRKNWRGAPGTPDIAYPSRFVAIFVNGCFWHGCKKCGSRLPRTNAEFWAKKIETNRARDKRKTRLLRKAGWMVITVPECELNRNIDAVLTRILRALSDKGLWAD